MEGFDVIVYDESGEQVHRKWCRTLTEAVRAVDELSSLYKDKLHSHSQGEVKLIGTWRD